MVSAFDSAWNVIKAAAYNLDDMPPGMTDEDNKRRHFQPLDDSQGGTSKNKLKNRMMRDAQRETEPPVDLDSDVAKAAARMSPVGGSQTRTSFSHGPGPRGYFGSPRASEREDRPREGPPMATTGPVTGRGGTGGLPEDELDTDSEGNPLVNISQPLTSTERQFMSQGEAKPMTMGDIYDMTPIEEAIKEMERQREMAFRQTPEGRRQTFKEHMQNIPYVERGIRYGDNTPHMYRNEDGFVMFG